MFASSKLLPSHGFAKTLSFPGGRQPPRDFRRSRGSVMTSEKSSANKKFPLLCMKIPYDSCVQGKSTVHCHCLLTLLLFQLVLSSRCPSGWSNSDKALKKTSSMCRGWIILNFSHPKIRFWWFEPVRSNECDAKCRMGPYASTMVKDPETGKVLASLVLWKKPCYQS